MSIHDELRSVERNLQNAIKSAFKKHIDQNGALEICADYATHSRLDEIVRALDLEVYGMSVTPSEFTITFQFTGSYQNIRAKAMPNHCRMCLDNDGNYELTIDEDDLSTDWYLTITDAEFNLKFVPEDVMADCLKQLSHELHLKVVAR